MKKETIERLLNTFGPAEYKAGPFITLPDGWFLLKLSPLPPLEERKSIVADICRNDLIRVDNGKVYHSPNCKRKNHNLSSNYHHIMDILENIEEHQYYVAVHPGQSNILNGQPIAIPIKPEINYIKYPDHPHLNNCRPGTFDNFDFFIPDTICYTNNPNNLGGNTFDKLYNAFKYITVWLFRHQIWLETRKFKKTGTWVGPSENAIEPKYYPGFLKPHGKCRCGSTQKYLNCHFDDDLKQLAKETSHSFKQLKYKFLDSKNWKENIQFPHESSLKSLKNIML